MSSPDLSDNSLRLQNLVTTTFQSSLEKEENQGLPLAVAAVQTLISVVQKCRAKTFTELQNEVTKAIQILDTHSQTSSRMAIPLNSVCNQFKMFVFRRHQNTSHAKIKELKKEVVERGRFFVDRAKKARTFIAKKAEFFIRDGSTILTHSKSSVVLAVLKHAKDEGKRFNVIITRTEPTGIGLSAAKEMEKLGIPVKVVLDSSVAVAMSEVDFVLVGAEGVTESGGIINRIGTYQMAILAKAMSRPFYVVVESHKFNRLYPLTQNDIPWKEKHRHAAQHELETKENDSDNAALLSIEKDRVRDYTPPEYITLLFTDLGVLTCSAVSDELIKLYQ
eukprot:359977_1